MKIGPPSVFFHSLFTFDLQSQELINNIMSDINSVSPGGGKSAPPVMFICANTRTSMLKQEQIVLERSARLNLDPGRGD